MILQPDPPSCLVALAIDQHQDSHCHAHIQLRHGSILSPLHHPNAVVITTHGETMVERCPGQQGLKTDLSAGTFIIEWNGGCNIDFVNFSILGVKQGTFQKQLTNDWFSLVNFNLSKLVEPHVMSFLNSPELLHNVKHVKDVLLSEPVITDSYTSWLEVNPGPLPWIIIVAIVMLVIVVFIVGKCYVLKRYKVPRETETKEEIGSSPLHPRWKPLLESKSAAPEIV